MKIICKRHLLRLNILFGISLFCFICYGQTTNVISRSIESRRMPVIELKGDAYNRGFQHGLQLKAEIAEVFKKWKENIFLSVKRDADSVITEFLDATNFRPVIRNWTPELLDEVKGISIGSGQKFHDVFAFQLVDEFWVYMDQKAHLTSDHCSGIGIASSVNHPAFIAQNMDLENYMNGYQVLLHIKATAKEPEQYILSCAGLIALNGMNSKGIGVCVNTLMELQASKDGLPVAFVIRGILSRKESDDALSFVKTVKHASGQNFIIGIRDSVYDFEASSGNVIRFQPVPVLKLVYHTNHALVNHDVKPWYADYHRRVLAGETNNLNSEIRYATLRKRIETSDREISADLIKTILTSKDDIENPVCRSFTEGRGVFTFSSVFFTLTGRKSVELTCGPPDQALYYQYFFK